MEKKIKGHACVTEDVTGHIHLTHTILSRNGPKIVHTIMKMQKKARVPPPPPPEKKNKYIGFCKSKGSVEVAHCSLTLAFTALTHKVGLR